MRTTRALYERYFEGVSTVFHPISIGMPELQPLLDPEAGLAELQSARDRMRAAVARAKSAQADQERIADRLIKADHALALLTAGFTIEPVQFGLEAGTPGTVAKRITSLEDRRKRSGARLVDFSLRAKARLRAALQQLNNPSQAGRIADARMLQQEVARLVPVLAALAPALPLLHDLGRKLSVWQMLLVHRGHQADPAKVDGVINELVEQLRGLVGQVSRCISGVSYPFPHARGAIALDQFVQPDAPPHDEGEGVFNESLACLDRLYPLYDEVLGRLAQIAARVEETLALEPACGRDGEGAPAPGLMARLRAVASHLGPEALAARRPPAGTRA
jgi:hypothetical protein